MGLDEGPKSSAPPGSLCEVGRVMSSLPIFPRCVYVPRTVPGHTDEVQSETENISTVRSASPSIVPSVFEQKKE